MITLLAALALGLDAKVEVATGYSGYATFSPGAPPNVDLDETGEPFKVYRRDKDLRVELGKELVLLCIKGDEYIVADLKKKQGARFVVKSERFPRGEKSSSGFNFPMYMMTGFFPVWPDAVFVLSAYPPVQSNFNKWASDLKPQELEHPTFGPLHVYNKEIMGESIAWQMRQEWGKAPLVLMWMCVRGNEMRTMAYTDEWQSTDAKPDLFEAPAGIKIEDGPGSDKVDWKVFKDFDTYIAWRDPLFANSRKPVMKAATE